MKKFVSTLLALALGVSAVAATAVLAEKNEEVALISANTQFELVVDGAVIEAPQVLYNEGNLMIPLRKVCETLGLTINWDAETDMITIEKLPVYITCYPNVDGYTFAKTAPIFLGEAPILIEGTTYVPVSFVDKILHGTSSIEGNRIIVTYAQTSALTANAVVTGVENGRLVVNDKVRGEVIANITEETQLVDVNGEVIGLVDLKEGSEIEITYGEVMTASLPPVTNAVKVVLVKKAEVVNTGVITEVNENKVTVMDDVMGEVVVNVTEETEIVDVNGEAKTISDLKADMRVNVVYSEAMTASLPPITNAVKVVLVKKAEVFNTGVITEVSENKVTVMDDVMGEVVVNVTENTEIVDAKGEAKTVSDLKADMRVDVVYSEAMTRSLPPITNGVKIVIK